MEKEICFETALKRLEEIAAKMEEGKLPLEESVKLYEEGVKLSKYCNWKLSDIDQKVETVSQMELSEEDIQKMEHPSKKSVLSTKTIPINKKKNKEIEKTEDEEDIDLPFFVSESEEEVYHS